MAAGNTSLRPHAARIDGQDDYPVTQISSDDAQPYCRWGHGRLPSVEEWEVAARAGHVFEYCTDATAPGRGGSWWCSQTTCNYYNLIHVGRKSARGSLPNQGFRMVRDFQAGVAWKPASRNGKAYVTMKPFESTVL